MPPSALRFILLYIFKLSTSQKNPLNCSIFSLFQNDIQIKGNTHSFKISLASLKAETLSIELARDTSITTYLELTVS